MKQLRNVLSHRAARPGRLALGVVINAGGLVALAHQLLG